MHSPEQAANAAPPGSLPLTDPNANCPTGDAWAHVIGCGSFCRQWGWAQGLPGIRLPLVLRFEIPARSGT